MLPTKVPLAVAGAALADAKHTYVMWARSALYHCLYHHLAEHYTGPVLPPSLHRAAGKFDGIICCAGGWAGGSVDSLEGLESLENMTYACMWSPALAGYFASTALKDTGVLTIVGSAAALQPTPTMIGYGAAKAAAHFMTRSLALPGAGLPEGTHVLGILPHTIDTPANRAGMPDADFSTWTNPDEIADKFLAWAAGEARPASGDLLEVRTVGSESSWHTVRE